MPTEEPKLRTSDVAQQCGVSLNTVRLYESLGYLPPVPRAANGYRQFQPKHVRHVKLVKTAMQCTWVGGSIRQQTLQMLIIAAQEDYVSAQNLATELQNMIGSEQAQAEAALQILEQWVESREFETEACPLQIGDAARRLRVTADELRSWERNGLLTVPRAANGYRLYGQYEINRLVVIRALRRARYSMMSILRLLHHLDNGDTTELREILDTPPLDNDLETYPTDSWLSTLQRMSKAAMRIQNILTDLANPP